MNCLPTQLSSVLSLVLGAAVALSPAAVADDDTSDAPAKVTANVIKVEASDDGQQFRIELRIENDEVTATVNGEKVPDERIVIDEDGGITILDDDGNPIGDHATFRPMKPGRVNDVDEVRIGIGEPPRPWVRAPRAPRAPAPEQPARAPQPDMPTPPVMLGVHMDEPDGALRRHLKLEPGASTLIVAVFEGLPAHRAGLREYDVIFAIDDVRPADPASIRKFLARRQPGDTVRADVIQEGTRKKVEITLDAFDADRMAEARLIGQPAAVRERGVNVLTGPGGELFKFSTDIDVDWESVGDVYSRALDLGRESGGAGWELFVRPHVVPAINEIREQIDVERIIESQSARVAESSEAIERAIERLQDRLAELEARLERRTERSDVDADRLMQRIMERMERMEQRVQQAIEAAQGRPD